MSVLIKGMEMPKSCIECPCLRHDSIDGKNAYQCNVTLEKFDIHGLPCSERDEGCPLDHFREVTKNNTDVRQILDRVAKEHPYKVQGNADSYSDYNQGWTDAVNRIDSMLPDVSDANAGNGSEIPNSSDLISRRMHGENMRKTRVDSFEEAINTINDNTYLDTENVRVILLSEIAGSLAVIADCMTEKKDGDSKLLSELQKRRKQPEIIRCGECKHRKIRGVDGFCEHITGEEIMVRKDEYCSWAERRTDG